MVLSTHSLEASSKHKMITASTFQDIQAALSKLHAGSVIFIDVDDTLITPVSKVFRAGSPHRFLIDDLKKNREQYANFETILSHWRLQRKTSLILQEWPELIHILKKNYLVYALTKMETGAIGDIPSMENWRYEELKDKGILFTPSFVETIEKTLIVEPSKPYSASFYKGIFITGSFNKSDVIRVYLKAEKPTQIVLIDDRPEYLEDVMQECVRQSFPFIGILFKGIEQIEGVPDSHVAEFQKRSLFDHAHWFEDEEAERLVSQEE
ncbi:MAG: DUF2608 domain-containing protein [Proteobacteria bacterium]|nr:DUF2608 domain-containing protein [Pseudomonadota bacterium]